MTRMPLPNDLTLESQGVRITFTWSDDRYTHCLTSTEGKLQSLEDLGIETPVFTDAHQQGDLLFLSGMSGDRHWSMSVEPTASGLAMDVACRVKSPVERIGSLYQQTGRIKAVAEEIAGSRSSEIVSLEANRLQVTATTISSEPPVTIHYRFRIEP